MNFPHYPVMNKEVLEIFSGTRKKLFVDCTVGAGGHSYRILAAFPQCRVIALDLDGASLDLARENLRGFGERVRFHQGSFIDLFEDFDLRRLDVSGVLVDPGISTVQLREERRGFSHTLDGPLDMRKDPAAGGMTAADVLNTFAEEKLADIFSRWGEVPNARRLAKAIIEKRLFAPWSSTAQLRRLVEDLAHWHARRGLVHPAAKVFQALRIFVNRELEGLDSWLQKIPGHLPPGSRVVFLTYHSLEDRMVKHAYQQLQRQAKAELLRPFPATPGAAEIAENLASRSAKLRALEVA